MRPAAAALALAALAAAGTAAAQTATTGTPQALFTRLIETDKQSASDVRDGLRARKLFVDADVTFADLTGDGRQDAVVSVDSGGAGGTIAVYVFSTDGGSKLRAVYRNQRLYRALTTVEGTSVLLRTPRYAAGDELCCPPTYVERTLTWSAKAKRMVRRSTDTVPAG